VSRPELPSFDLVVASVGRTNELGLLLESLERQTHSRFRVVVVDQNEDERIGELLAAHPRLTAPRLRSERGLSRARNRAFEELDADVVAFPDDDCAYPDDLLERVGQRLLAEPGLDGVSGRAVARDGGSSPSWEHDPAILTDDNLWNRVNSAALFLRRGLLERVGGFDEALGLGSGNPWSSGEEVDLVIRSVRAGARIAYDPELTVIHETAKLDRRLGYRDGASVGYLLRKHRYPWRVRARMLVRPVGGLLLSLVQGDLPRARYHLATLRGRVAGLGAARSA
jgi:GT2 family glycosyltransferase